MQEINTPDGYTSAVTGDAEDGYVITNSYTPETKESATTTTIPSTTSTTEIPIVPKTTAAELQTTSESVSSETANKTAAGTESTLMSETSQTDPAQDTETTTTGVVTVQESVPSTGDHSHMGLFGLIMAVCAAAITVNLVLRRRSSEK